MEHSDRAPMDAEFDFYVQGFRITVMEGFLALEETRRDPDPAVAGSPPHTHSWYELFCVTHGSRAFSVEGERMTLYAGECLAVAPGCTHYAQASNDGECLAFDISLQKLPGKTVPGPLESVLRLRGAGRFPMSPEGTRAAALANAALESREMLRASTYLWELLLDLCRAHEHSSVEDLLSDSSMSRIYKLEQLMDSYYTANIPLKKLSQALHISTRQLSRVIRQQYGCTYREKIGALRMQAAAHLLLVSELTERQIAVHVGYQSRRTFEAHFIRSFGMTSAEYRAHGRNPVAEPGRT